MGAETSPVPAFADLPNDTSTSGPGTNRGARPPIRRRATGAGSEPGVNTTMLPLRSGALSPLNPRSRGQSGLTASALSNQMAGPPLPLSPTTPTSQQTQKQKRTISLGRTKA